MFEPVLIMTHTHIVTLQFYTSAISRGIHYNMYVIIANIHIFLQITWNIFLKELWLGQPQHFAPFLLIFLQNLHPVSGTKIATPQRRFAGCFAQLGAHFGDSQLLCFSTRTTMEWCLAAERRGANDEGWKVRLVRFVHPILLFFLRGGLVGTPWVWYVFLFLLFIVISMFPSKFGMQGGVEKESGIGTLKASPLDERVWVE